MINYQKNNIDENTIRIPDLPGYDLILSQVLEFLGECFPYERFTKNIIQNYIKNEVISKPSEGRKRGYTRAHLIQMILLFYMKPVLTADEIKKVFSLAFNDINNAEDDIITWEEAYSIFKAVYEDRSVSDSEAEEEMIENYLLELMIRDEDIERIKKFINVLILVAKSGAIKRKVKIIIER